MDKGHRSRRKSRICMLSGRAYALNAFRCAFYEAQDVLADVDEVDLICLQPRRAYDMLYPLQKHLIWRDFTGRAVSFNMVFDPVRLSGEYDLFVAYLPLTQDLIQLSGIRGWRDHCKRSICWIDEEYAANVDAYRNWYSALDPFDHVAVGLSGTAQDFGKAIRRTCHYVPGAVDAIRYSPHPDNPARVIDIYSVGRIWKGVHEAFRNFAATEGLFYVHDTFLASHAHVKDYRQHRQMHANMAKRSRYYNVMPAKMDVQAGGPAQVEVGFRYYEATAAGSILVGQAPDCEAFHTTFDWPDAVIPVREDGRDVPEVLTGLAADPKRRDGISCRNSAEALLRHDWVYRWKRIYEIVGLDETEGMRRREMQLKRMAEQIGNGRTGTARP